MVPAEEVLLMETYYTIHVEGHGMYPGIYTNRDDAEAVAEEIRSDFNPNEARVPVVEVFEDERLR